MKEKLSSILIPAVSLTLIGWTFFYVFTPQAPLALGETLVVLVVAIFVVIIVSSLGWKRFFRKGDG